MSLLLIYNHFRQNYVFLQESKKRSKLSMNKMKFPLRKTNYLGEFAHKANEMHWCQELLHVDLNLIYWLWRFSDPISDDLVFHPIIHVASIRPRRHQFGPPLRTGLWIGRSGFDSRHTLTACWPSDGKQRRFRTFRCPCRGRLGMLKTP